MAQNSNFRNEPENPRPPYKCFKYLHTCRDRTQNLIKGYGTGNRDKNDCVKLRKALYRVAGIFPKTQKSKTIFKVAFGL